MYDDTWSGNDIYIRRYLVPMHETKVEVKRELERSIWWEAEARGREEEATAFPCGARLDAGPGGGSKLSCLQRVRFCPPWQLHVFSSHITITHSSLCPYSSLISGPSFHLAPSRHLHPVGTLFMATFDHKIDDEVVEREAKREKYLWRGM